MVDISQGMSDAAMYEFDMNGVIVFRNALSPARVRELKKHSTTRVALSHWLAWFLAIVLSRCPTVALSRCLDVSMSL